jgi:hypothetical protein
VLRDHSQADRPAYRIHRVQAAATAAQKLPDGGDPAACREVGFWLGEPHWGRGFMPEALGAMLRYGFENLNLSTVYARHFLDNTRSRILLEHCGFAYDHTEYDNSFPSLGEIRDEDVLALTAQNWRELRKQLNVPDAPKHIGSGAYWGSDPHHREAAAVLNMLMSRR